MPDKIRWEATRCILGNAIVGVIEQHFADKNCWFAWGCDVDWQDVNLHSHKTEATAKRAVKRWVEDRL